MRTRIEIDTRTFIRFWLVVVGFVLAALVIERSTSALIIIGVAAFLALALNKPVSALANLLPGKSRVGGTAVAYIIIVLLLGGFLLLVIPPMVEQSAKVASTLPTIIDTAQTQWHGINNFLAHYGLQDSVNNALNSAKQNATSWAASIGGNLLASVGSFFGLVISTFLVLVLSFLMLVEAPNWLTRIWGVYSDEDRMEHHQKLVGQMYDVVTGYVTGQLTVSGIGAFFAGLTVFILSFIFAVPHSLALPTVAIAFVLSLIPMFGATIAGVLICLLLAFNDITAAIVFAVYFVVYQQIENNFISPTIQSKTVELSALTVLAAVTIGVTLFGIAGGVISIPIAGCVKVLLEDYLERAKKRRIASEKPLHKLARKIEGEV
jgi:predicted PurR-regulated permease PerM